MVIIIKNQYLHLKFLHYLLRLCVWCDQKKNYLRRIKLMKFNNRISYSSQGGSKMLNLDSVISNMIKTSSNHEQRVRRFMTSREEAVNRCLNSLIHTLSCKDGDSCRAHGCLKMKRVVEHTKTCPRKNNNFRGCSICTQLMNLCFYHSKICRAHVCHVPFCRIMKKKLQALNELYAQKQSIQSYVYFTIKTNFFIINIVSNFIVQNEACSSISNTSTSPASFKTIIITVDVTNQ